MTAHPYPQKLVTAVANVLWPEMYVSGRAYELADKVLSALWEASRVVDVDQLPDDAVYLNDLGGIGFVGADRNTHMVDHMEHILHWGDEL